MNHRALVVLLPALLLLDCRPVESERVTRENFAPPAVLVQDAAAVLPTLEGEWLQPFRDRDGVGVGWISVPIGANGKRPLVVAVHRAQSRPDAMCSVARASLGPYPFIVCPHPVERTIDASWGSAARLHTAIDAAVNALLVAFDPYVDTADAMYLGHSQGAMLAPEALAMPSAYRFRSAVLFEGLPRDERAAKAQLVRANLAHLLLLSGQSGWSGRHEAFAKTFDSTSIAARHVHAEMGHFFGERTFTLIREQVDWLVGDTPAWKGR